MGKKEVPNTEDIKKEDVVETDNSTTTIDENVAEEPKLVEEEKADKKKIFIKREKEKAEITEDAKATKNIAWLAYILFFIPLLINRTSPFVRHNANEGLEINIFDAIASVLLILGAVLPIQAQWVHLLTILFTVAGIGLFLLTTVTKIYMITYAAQGIERSTPFLWSLRIIK